MIYYWNVKLTGTPSLLSLIVQRRKKVKTIYLVSEYNVREPEMLIGPTTIWACIGNSDDYENHGTKIAGPIPGIFAGKVIEGLKVFLERLGHEVVVETTADD